MERFSGEGCLTKWAADSASSFVCPRTASSPSSHLLSRDMASFSFAVLSQALGKSGDVESILWLDEDGKPSVQMVLRNVKQNGTSQHPKCPNI